MMFRDTTAAAGAAAPGGALASAMLVRIRSPRISVVRMLGGGPASPLSVGAGFSLKFSS